MSHKCTRCRDIAAIWCWLQYFISTLGSRRTWQCLLVLLVDSSSCDLYLILFLLFFPPCSTHPSIGVPRTRDCVRNHVVDYVKVGAVDGPRKQSYNRYILSFSLPKKEGHSEHAHPKTTTRAVIVHWAKGGSTRTYRRLGPPIISIVLFYHLRIFYAVIHIIHQTCCAHA